MHKFILSIIVLIFQLKSINSTFTSSTAHLLCEKLGRLNLIGQEIVILYEDVGDYKPMMKESIEDVLCWAKKNFLQKTIFRSTEEDLCYDLHHRKVKPASIILVISEARADDRCPMLIYGPVPNVISLNSYVSETGNFTYSRALVMGFKNAGGLIRTSIDLQQPDATTRIHDTLSFFIHNLDMLTPYYGRISNWWQVNQNIPPTQYARKERQHRLLESHDKSESNSTIIMISCLPMLLLAVSLSVYLVIHPRNALKYSDEEIDYIIETIDETMPPLPPTINNANTTQTQRLPPKNVAEEKIGGGTKTTDTRTKGTSDDEVHTNSTMKSESEKGHVMGPIKSKGSARLRLSFRPPPTTRKPTRSNSPIPLRLAPTKQPSTCEMAIDRTLSSN